MKVCQVVFSTNRPEYLAKTLASQSKLQWPAFWEVHRILFDDFPKDRVDALIRDIAYQFCYSEVYLHGYNESLGATWAQCWRILKNRDYDFVWMQEDDVEILCPVNLILLTEYLKQNMYVSQLRLARQAWYHGEQETDFAPTDTVVGPYRIETNDSACYFSPMASLYNASITHIDYQEWFRQHYPKEPALVAANPNEGLVGKVLLEGYGQLSRTVKNSTGGPMVNHFGEYTHGRILLPHEPGYARFAYRNPEQWYCSKTGKLYASSNFYR